MCDACKASEMGRSRQTGLDAATAALTHLGLTPQMALSLWTQAVPPGQERDEQQMAAAQRWNVAAQQMARLHLDYQATLTRTVQLSPQEIAHCIMGLQHELHTYRVGGNREMYRQIAVLLGKLDPDVYSEAKIQELLEGV